MDRPREKSGRRSVGPVARTARGFEDAFLVVKDKNERIAQDETTKEIERERNENESLSRRGGQSEHRRAVERAE
jgi:hypothetical protein